MSGHPTSVCFDYPDTHVREEAAVPCLGNGARRCPRLLDKPTIWLFGVCLEKDSSYELSRLVCWNSCARVVIPSIAPYAVICGGILRWFWWLGWMFRGASQGPKRLYAKVFGKWKLLKLPGNIVQTFGATTTIPQAQKDVKCFTCKTQLYFCYLVFAGVWKRDTKKDIIQTWLLYWTHKQTFRKLLTLRVHARWIRYISRSFYVLVHDCCQQCISYRYQQEGSDRLSFFYLEYLFCWYTTCKRSTYCLFLSMEKPSRAYSSFAR